MYRKRTAALFMFLLIGVMVATGCFTQYKADYYLDYSPYEYYMSSKFTLPYRTTVDKNRNSMTYQTLINAWQIATFNLSNVTDYSKKRIGYYEAFLFDFIHWL